MWGIIGDLFNTLKGVGLLDVVNLSLDEPKLNSVIFNDNEEDDVNVEETKIVIIKY